MRVAARLTPWFVLIALLASTFFLARIFNAQIRIGGWLFWRYAAIWFPTLLFCASCLSAGKWIVSRLSQADPRSLEHFVLSFASGVFAFFLVTTIVGLFGGLDRVSFVLIPLLLLALGARLIWRDVLELRARIRHYPQWLALTPFEVVAFAAGAIALCVIYLGVLVPDNAAYDSRWYHLGLAEHYAAAGGIFRLPEGRIAATIPHLASILYAWAFCLPWGELFDRLELAAHLEFAIFVLTLPGIVALVRYLLPGVRARGAWITIFAFPSVFLYDSGLHVAADHIAALWAIPTLLAFARAFIDLDPRACLLLAMQASGLLMTKYTCGIVVLGPGLALVARVVQLGVLELWRRPRRFTAWRGLVVPLVAGLLFTAPHWLKNLIWYGDPMYPMLHKYLSLRPWNSQASFILEVYLNEAWGSVGTFDEKLEGTWLALRDYSYGLYSWMDFHGMYPIFGSLFTFSLFALPFLRDTRRIWAVVLMAHVGIAAWFWLFHAERYLQPLLPWMAAVVASIALLAWRSGVPARLGVIALGGLQLVWGADMLFWPLHRMTGKSAIGLVDDFFAKGYANRGQARSRPFEDLAALGRGLPKGATVLLHHDHLTTGLGTQVVADASRIQYGINYGELGSPRAVHQLFKDYGVTHVVWRPRTVHGEESLAGELVFHAYARYWQVVRSYGGRSVAALPNDPPPEQASTVLVYACDGGYQPGLYDISDLQVSPYVLPDRPRHFPLPREPYSPEMARSKSYGYAMVNQACPGAPKLTDYQQIAAYGTQSYYVGSAPKK